jgi:hypothetical protein
VAKESTAGEPRVIYSDAKRKSTARGELVAHSTKTPLCFNLGRMQERSMVECSIDEAKAVGCRPCSKCRPWE